MAKEGFSQYEIAMIRKMKDKVELTKRINMTLKGSSAPFTKPEDESEFAVPTHELSLEHIHCNSIPELPPATEWTILF